MSEQNTLSSAQDTEKQALASFGIRNFNSEKFENSDEDSILVRSPIKSRGIDAAFAAFCDAISIEDALPEHEKKIKSKASAEKYYSRFFGSMTTLHFSIPCVLFRFLVSNRLFEMTIFDD